MTPSALLPVSSSFLSLEPALAVELGLETDCGVSRTKYGLGRRFSAAIRTVCSLSSFWGGGGWSLVWSVDVSRGMGTKN